MNDRLEQLLNVANDISSGKVPIYQHNETFTSGAFDLLLIKVKGNEAFELLTQLCQQYESVRDSHPNLQGYYYLTTQIAHQTGTTEMPEKMREIISGNPTLSVELKQWYRYVG